ILGDARLGDRLERVSYNALPATLSNDMWSHQYDQQPNQIACTRAHRQWSTNGDDSNLFGLEPNFGCCTANLHQGWPKFVSNIWMATPDGGLVTVAYAPSEVHTQLKGKEVAIQEETEYPFRGDVRLTVHASGSGAFPLLLRLPDWTPGMTVKVNGAKAANVTVEETRNGFYPLRRSWHDGDVVSISFPMHPRVTHWFHDSAVFEQGPLVFSLPLDGDWNELKKYAAHSGDWQITPKKDWNYAVEVGDCSAKAIGGSIGSTPFDVQHPPVSLEVKARVLPDWRINENSAGPLPLSPVSSQQPLQPLRLVPYGAAKLRITAFPFLNEKSRCETRAALNTDQRQSASH
nr:glycoside hydrolase family 127 protein [Acidobacteriota bacterium]